MSLSSVGSETAKKFKYWQFRMMSVTWVAYAMSYVMRHTLTVAMPMLAVDLDITKAQLGAFMTAHGAMYGLSKFLNGFVAHKFKASSFIACGLIVCAATSFIFGFSSGTYVMGSMWLIQGLFQGMFWPPIARLLSYWIPPNELATKTSLWNTSHCVGTIAILLAAAPLSFLSFGWSGWRNVFFAPAIFAVIMAVGVRFLIKDTPSSVGLPEISVGENSKKVKGTRGEKEESAEYKSFIKKRVFKNPYMWIIAVSNLFVYVVRFTVLMWGPILLLQWKGMSLAEATSTTALFEAVGIPGIIVCGWVTDKYFNGKGHHVCAIAMTLSCLFIFLFVQANFLPTWILITFLVISGFFINGAQSLILIVTSSMATKRAAATANGFVGVWGYSATAITGILFSFVQGKYGWQPALQLTTALGIIGSILLFFAWKAKATGYEELEAESKKIKT
ncbi:putative hexose phosphate transport protein [Endomicrobiia bacterium]|nr:putative hexose phosphate transport protein [Endomicrobiia bacterium]